MAQKKATQQNKQSKQSNTKTTKTRQTTLQKQDIKEVALKWSSIAMDKFKAWAKDYYKKLKSSDKQVKKKAWRNLIIGVSVAYCVGVLLFAQFYRPATHVSTTKQGDSQQKEEPKIDYKITADKESYEFTCAKLTETDSSSYVHCETDGEVTGVYEPAEHQGIAPSYVTAEDGKWHFSAKSVSIDKSDLIPSSGFADDKVPHSKETSVSIRLTNSSKDLASTSVKIKFVFSDAVYNELLTANRKKAAEYAAAAPERARQQHISDLKACRVATNDWTEAEAGEYADDYVKCRQQEYDKEKSSWESTAPSEVDARTACRTEAEAQYYKVKIHNVVGVLSTEVLSAHERLYKVQVDVTNIYGATRQSVMECKVSNASGSVRVTSLNIP